MKTLRHFNVTNKRLLVRADFNVSLKDGQIVDDFRIRTSLPTIKYLLENQAKIILISHLARPAGQREKKYSLQPIAQRLSELIKQPVKFLDDCLGSSVQKAINQMSAGQIIFLENLRFYPGEENNQPEFAKQLANLAEIYVNDAFGVCHRTHASIVSLPRYLPRAAGLLLEKEIKILSRLLEKPEHPLVVIIGGVKISTKFKVIKNFLAKADHLCLGGALANTILRAQGIAIGQSLIEEEMIEKIKELNLTDTRLHLPVDVVTSFNSQNHTFNRIAPVGGTQEEEKILDIGPVVARSIYEWFREKHNLKFLEKLKKVGVKIIEPKKEKKNLILSGKTFVLTGALRSMTRDKAKEKIRQLGGKVSSSVSKNTDFVVVGELPGSKFQKAKKLGIKTISEKEFLKMIK